MKLVIRTLFFHFIIILVFTIIYYNIRSEFQFTPEHNPTILDFILFATTIQSGVGIYQLYPLSYIGKTFLTLQQIIMLCSHVITLYVFTI